MRLELRLSAVGSVPCDDSPQMKQLELQCFGEGDSAISGVNVSVRQISETSPMIDDGIPSKAFLSW